MFPPSIERSELSSKREEERSTTTESNVSLSPSLPLSGEEIEKFNEKNTRNDTMGRERDRKPCLSPSAQRDGSEACREAYARSALVSPSLPPGSPTGVEVDHSFSKDSAMSFPKGEGRRGHPLPNTELKRGAERKNSGRESSPVERLVSYSPHLPSYMSPYERDHYDLLTGEVRSFSNSLCSSFSKSLTPIEELPYVQPASRRQFVPAPDCSDSSADGESGKLDMETLRMKREYRFRRDYTPSPYLPVREEEHSVYPSYSPEGYEEERDGKYMICRDGAVRTPICHSSSRPREGIPYRRYYSKSSGEMQSVRGEAGKRARPRLDSRSRDHLTPSLDEPMGMNASSTVESSRRTDQRRRAWSRLSSAAGSLSASRTESHVRSVAPPPPLPRSPSHLSSVNYTKSKKESIARLSQGELRSQSGVHSTPSPTRETAVPLPSIAKEFTRLSPPGVDASSLPSKEEGNPPNPAPLLLPPSLSEDSDPEEQAAPATVKGFKGTLKKESPERNAGREKSISFEEAYRKYVLEADARHQGSRLVRNGTHPTHSVLDATSSPASKRSFSSHSNNEEASRKPYILGSAYKKYLCSPTPPHPSTPSHSLVITAAPSFEVFRTGNMCDGSPGYVSPGRDSGNRCREEMMADRSFTEPAEVTSATFHERVVSSPVPLSGESMHRSLTPHPTSFVIPPSPSSTSPRSLSAQSERSISKTAATINKWRKILYENNAPRLLAPPSRRTSIGEPDNSIRSNDGWQFSMQSEGEGSPSLNVWNSPKNAKRSYDSPQNLEDFRSALILSESPEHSNELGCPATYYASLSTSQRRNDIHMRALMEAEEKKLKRYFAEDEYSSRKLDEREEWNVSTALSFVEERQRRASLTPPSPQTPTRDVATATSTTITTSPGAVPTFVIPSSRSAPLVNTHISMLSGKENLEEYSGNESTSGFRGIYSSKEEAPVRDSYWMNSPAAEREKRYDPQEEPSSVHHATDSFPESATTPLPDLRARSVLNTLEVPSGKMFLKAEEDTQRQNPFKSTDVMPSMGDASGAEDHPQAPTTPNRNFSSEVAADERAGSADKNARMNSKHKPSHLLQEVEKTKQKSEALARHLVRTLEEKHELQVRLARLEEKKQQLRIEEKRKSTSSVNAQFPLSARDSSYPSSLRSGSLGGIQVALRTKEKELAIFEEEIHRLNGVLRKQQEQAAQAPHAALVAHAVATAEVDAAMSELGMAHLSQRRAEERAEQLAKELESAVSAIYTLDGKVVELQKAAMMKAVEEIRSSAYAIKNAPEGSHSLSISPITPKGEIQENNQALMELIVRAEGLLQQCNDSRTHSDSYVSSLQQTCRELRTQLQQRGGKVEELQQQCEALRRDKNVLRLYGTKWLQQLLDVKADAEIIADIVRTSKADAEMVVANSIQADSFLNVSVSSASSPDRDAIATPFMREHNASSRHFANLVMHDMKAVARYLTALQQMSIGEKEGYEMLERLANGKPLLLLEEEMEEEENSDVPHLAYKESSRSDNNGEQSHFNNGYLSSAMLSRFSAPACFLIQQKKQFVLNAVEEALRAQQAGATSPLRLTGTVDAAVDSSPGATVHPSFLSAPPHVSSIPPSSLPRVAFQEGDEEEAVEAEALHDGEAEPSLSRAPSPIPSLGNAPPAGLPMPAGQSIRRSLFSGVSEGDEEERWSEFPDRQSLPSRDRSTTAKPAESSSSPRDSFLPASQLVPFLHYPASSLPQPLEPLPTKVASQNGSSSASHHAPLHPQRDLTPSSGEKPKPVDDYDEPTLPFFSRPPPSGGVCGSSDTNPDMNFIPSTAEEHNAFVLSTSPASPLTEKVQDLHAIPTPNDTAVTTPPVPPSSFASPSTVDPPHPHDTELGSQPDSHAIGVVLSPHAASPLSSSFSSYSSPTSGNHFTRSNSREGICGPHPAAREGLRTSPGMLPRLQGSFSQGTITKHEETDEKSQHDKVNDSRNEAETPFTREGIPLSFSASRPQAQRPPSSSLFAPTLVVPSPPPSMKGGEVHKRLTEEQIAPRGAATTPVLAASERLSEGQSVEVVVGPSPTMMETVEETNTPISSERTCKEEEALLLGKSSDFKIILPSDEPGFPMSAGTASPPATSPLPSSPFLTAVADPNAVVTPFSSAAVPSPMDVPAIGQRLPLPPSTSRGSAGSLEGRRSDKMPKGDWSEKMSAVTRGSSPPLEGTTGKGRGPDTAPALFQESGPRTMELLPVSEGLPSMVESRNRNDNAAINDDALPVVNSFNEGGAASSTESENAVRFARRRAEAAPKSRDRDLASPASGNLFTSSRVSSPASPLASPDNENGQEDGRELQHARGVPVLSMPATSPLPRSEGYPVSPRFPFTSTSKPARHAEKEEGKSKKGAQDQAAGSNSPQDTFSAPSRPPSSVASRLPLRSYTSPILPIPQRAHLRSAAKSGDALEPTSDGTPSHPSDNTSSTPPLSLTKESEEKSQVASSFSANSKAGVSSVSPILPHSGMTGRKSIATSSSENPASTLSDMQTGNLPHPNNEAFQGELRDTPTRPTNVHSFSFNHEVLTLSPIRPDSDEGNPSSRLSISSLPPFHVLNEGANDLNLAAQDTAKPTQKVASVKPSGGPKAISSPRKPRSISPLLAKIREKVQKSGRGSGTLSTSPPPGNEKGRASVTGALPSPRHSSTVVVSGFISGTDPSGRRDEEGNVSASGRSSVGDSNQSISGRSSVSNAERKEKVAQILERARAAREKQ